MAWMGGRAPEVGFLFLPHQRRGFCLVPFGIIYRGATGGSHIPLPLLAGDGGLLGARL